MFKFLNKKGQVALILVLITAIALIFYAVILNLGKLSQHKTATTLAANFSASAMASSLASYSENLYQTQLGGENNAGGGLTVCGYTGVFSALLALVIVIVVGVLTGGTGVPFMIALFAAAASVILQVMVVQPGLTDLWNKFMENLTPTDQFVERGISVGLQNAVTDSTLIPDDLDLDVDGVFGQNDQVGRFAFYYTERLKRIEPVDIKFVKDFQEALREFLYKGEDEWGLYDPAGCEDINSSDPLCNPCCVPPELILSKSDGSTIATPIIGRPEECPKDIATLINLCRGGPFGADYPFVYDRFFERQDNNIPPPPVGADILIGANGGIFLDDTDDYFRSFREHIGIDDEHPLFETRPAHNVYERQRKEGNDFRSEDTRGFHIWLQVEPPEELWDPESGTPKPDTYRLARVGLHEFLWNMRDYGVQLARLFDDDAYVDGFAGGNACFWCTQDYVIPTGEANPQTCGSQVSDLTLPDHCFGGGDEEENLGYPGERDVCVDGNIDKITNIDGAFTPSDECSPGPQGWWKPGADRYCSEDWPYFGLCPKHSTRNCYENGVLTECGGCGDPWTKSQNAWPDDELDDFTYGVREFIDWAQDIIQADPKRLALNFDGWKDGVKTWFVPNPDDPEDTDGAILLWQQQVARWYAEVRGWVQQPLSPSGTCDMTDPDYTWCPAPSANCLGVTQEEMEGESVKISDMGKVNACHGFNANNATKFWKCYDECNDIVSEETGEWQGNCSNLPRSLAGAELYPVLYGECGEDWTGPCASLFEHYPEDAEVFQECLDACEEEGDSAEACEKAIELSQQEERYQDLSGLGGSVPDSYQACIDSINDGNCTEGGAATACFDIPATRSGFKITYAKSAIECNDDCKDTNAACEDVYNILKSKGSEHLLLELDCSDDSNFRKELDKIIATWAEDCSTESAYYEWLTDEGDPCEQSEFQQAVYGNWKEAKAFCYKDEVVDPDTGELVLEESDFMKAIRSSALLAECHDPKMQLRGDFIFQRHQDANALDDVLLESSNKFDEFLSNPAVQLIVNLANTDTSSGGGGIGQDEGLPYQAIYGWRSDPPAGQTRGYWHIVRVDSRVPGRCDDQCGRQGQPEGGLPTIKSYTKHWGIKRCYSLVDSLDTPGCNAKSDYKNVDRCFKGGTVKSRITRFDENREALAFPDNIPLWQFRFNRPAVGSTAVDSVEDLSGLCDQDIRPGDGAFMLNEQSDNPACWARVNALLNQGVRSETCGEYFFHKRTPRGFGLKFAPCAGGF